MWLSGDRKQEFRYNLDSQFYKFFKDLYMSDGRVTCVRYCAYSLVVYSDCDTVVVLTCVHEKPTPAVASRGLRQKAAF